MPDRKLTRSERIALAALRSCGGEAHGLEIVKASGGLISRTSIYIMLSHLQDKGYVSSKYVRAWTYIGPRRRIYHITPEGTAAFNAEVAAHD